MTTFRSGFVGIIGIPNVGKSTLLNALVGEKVSIVSPKPQTTRNRILGILNAPDHQVVFLDTPGIHEARNQLQTIMVETALQTLGSCEVLLFVLDSARGLTTPDLEVIDRFAPLPTPRLAVLNKIDLVAKEKLLPLMASLAEKTRFDALIPVSALTGDGLERIVPALLAFLPESERLYDPDLYTDLPERFLAAELVREQLFLQLRQEVPYGTAVSIESFTREKRLTEIQALILVEREQHKKIVVGKAGAGIKAIGSAARLELERLLGRKVLLKLFVKVSEGWTGKPSLLSDLGYTLDHP